MALTLINRTARRVGVRFTFGTTDGPENGVPNSLRSGGYAKIPAGQWIVTVFENTGVRLRVHVNDRAGIDLSREMTFPLVSDGTTTVRVWCANASQVTGDVLMVLEEAPPA